ncbi:MAG: elongation factor P [Paludibacteraceae bacterium]|nr:elongation factor P [Paludibacteraceae bacterium]
MATTADFKTGMCIEHKGDLYYVINFLHVKPGKGNTFVRVKLKNVKTGLVLEERFDAGIRINVARVERRPYQFLYKDDMGYNLMDTETYEQMSVDGKTINGVEFMKDGEMIECVFHADTETYLYADMPNSVVLEVTYTEPGIKGDTATNTLKPATLETGAEVRVPLFINIGDKIRVNTQEGTYMERARE